MKNITVPGNYLTRDGHLVGVRREVQTFAITTYEGVVVKSGPLLPAGRFMHWNADGRFVGSMAGEAHALDIVRRA